MRAQARLDVAQTFAESQLRKGHAQELIQVRERQRRIAAWILRNTSAEGVQRQMLHQLSKYQLPRMHRAPPGKNRELLLQIGNTLARDLSSWLQRIRCAPAQDLRTVVLRGG